MSIDYDAPRTRADDETAEPPDELKTDKASPAAAVIDVDDGDLADTFELPGADLSSAELLVHIVPVQPDEFTCVSCFLVHHRSQLARESDGNKCCTECES
ncbi:DUF4193 domain-containing protein [Pseudarthrobacter sp. NS4]|uniref:DUF4193 domain-containing protein n=1 Tax=Pseudarthrobacter sp. NS4 TaxID=2973976 RepID=UPI0021637D69|nr:DUF4193 domain-containing protein [Pseudarthrobacter sp. NS4]